MKPEILNQLTWRDVREISEEWNDYVCETVTGRAREAKTVSGMYKDVLNRLKEKAK